jgi:putative ABC transport system permease protein
VKPRQATNLDPDRKTLSISRTLEMKITIPAIEILKTAHQALLRNWGRAVLTSLSMVIGTASLVLVIIVGISGRSYVLELIQGLGSNLIYVDNEGTDSASGIRTYADRINPGDLKAIQTEIRGIRCAAPIVASHPAVTIEGAARMITLIGSTPDYQQVRNLEVVQGSFISENDLRFRNKVCLISELMTKKLRQDPLYKGYINFYNIRFDVIGTFREHVSSHGGMEITDYTAIIPISVMRNFKQNDMLDTIYVSAERFQDVPRLTDEIFKLVVRRHRNQGAYAVHNLGTILKAADQISQGLTVVLLLIAAISLIASGISIMNVMLITVTERTREIGIKKSIGAYRRVLLSEFLAEALILSGGGGLAGIVLGVAVPYSIRFFTSAIKIEIPPAAIILGLGVTLLVGLTFGMIPALRASRMNPVEALRYE